MAKHKAKRKSKKHQAEDATPDLTTASQGHLGDPDYIPIPQKKKRGRKAKNKPAEPMDEFIDVPPPEDPWSSNQHKPHRCATCTFFVEKNPDIASAAIGRCRKNAPTIGGYPVVFDIDWCGEHRLDETKV